MKLSKILLLGVGLMVCALSVASAQQTQLTTTAVLTTPRTPVIDKTVDTVNNTGTGKLDVAVSSFQNEVSIQVNLTNISGTTAGTATLWGSLDGINWQQVPSIIQTTGVVGLDSWSPSSSSLTHIFVIALHAYSNYEVRYTGASTMSVAMKGKAIWRRQP